MTTPESNDLPERCEFCGLILVRQTEPFFFPGPPPSEVPPEPADWSGWQELGSTDDTGGRS